MKKVYTLLWMPALLVTLTLIVANFLLGDLNQDEGWYLYAAKLVAQGELPYIDFAATQGPVMYLTYGALWPLVESMGVAGGRLITALFGFGCILCSAWLAARIAPDGRKNAAALIAFMLVGMNVFQSYFCVIVKTYALSGLLVLAGFIALTYATGKRYIWCALLAGLFFALAAGTRTSAGVIIPVVFLCLLISQSRSKKSQVEGPKSENENNQDSAIRVPRSELSPAHSFPTQVSGLIPHPSPLPPCPWCLLLGGIIGCCIIFVPFLIKAPVAFLFGLLEYHSARDVGGLASILAYKAGFISRVVQSYFVPIALFLVASSFALVNRHPTNEEPGTGNRELMASSSILPSPLIIHHAFGVTSPSSLIILPILLLSVMAVTLVHFMAPFPYDDYQAMIFPVFAVVIAVMLTRLLSVVSDSGSGSSAGGGSAFGVKSPSSLIIVFLLCLASAFSSPVNHKWFIGERDVIWWPLKEECALKRLHRTAGLIKSLTVPGDKLLTQDPYLAVEAGRDLPEGLELGPFSYFPDMTHEKAAACHVLNRGMLVDLILSGEAPVAALSGWGFAIDSPSITRLAPEERELLWTVFRRKYSEIQKVDNFGHAGTTLHIFLRSTQ